MSGFELNKIAGAVLLAGLIAMVTGTVADKLYKPDFSKKRGFQVAVEEGASTEVVASQEEEKIDIAALLNAASVDAGKAISKKCETCHNLEKGGANKVGPALWGIVGHPRGVHEGFSYSDAMKSKGGNWSYEDLFTFIKKPNDLVPGTKMAFAGIKKPQDIANLVSYLRTLSDSPVPLPVAAPAAESKAEVQPASATETSKEGAQQQKPEEKASQGL